jgi:hypothetical protein
MVWKIIGSTTLDEMNGPRELASNRHHLQQFLPDLVQKPIPLANPPFSFGIFCQKAVLAFRNITLTPLPRNP